MIDFYKVEILHHKLNLKVSGNDWLWVPVIITLTTSLRTKSTVLLIHFKDSVPNTLN